MAESKLWLLIGVAVLVTALLRFLPFLLFGRKNPPMFIVKLGKVLPTAIIGMLVVYCLKDISFKEPPHALPELLSILAVAILHCLKKNTLLSVVGGTLLYCILIRLL